LIDEKQEVLSLLGDYAQDDSQYVNKIKVNGVKDCWFLLSCGFLLEPVIALQFTLYLCSATYVNVFHIVTDLYLICLILLQYLAALIKQYVSTIHVNYLCI